MYNIEHINIIQCIELIPLEKVWSWGQSQAGMDKNGQGD